MTPSVWSEQCEASAYKRQQPVPRKQILKPPSGAFETVAKGLIRIKRDETCCLDRQWVNTTDEKEVEQLGISSTVVVSWDYLPGTIIPARSTAYKFTKASHPASHPKANEFSGREVARRYKWVIDRYELTQRTRLASTNCALNQEFFSSFHSCSFLSFFLPFCLYLYVFLHSCITWRTRSLRHALAILAIHPIKFLSACAAPAGFQLALPPALRQLITLFTARCMRATQLHK